MAKQTKKEGTTKPTTKKAKVEIKNDAVEEIEKNIAEENNATEVIDATEVGVDIEKIEEAITSIDTSINDEEIEKEINNDLDTMLSEIKDVNDGMAKLEEDKEKFNEEITKSPEKSEKIIKKEIEKTQQLKKEIEKKISSNNTGKVSITSWWNGMGYDF